MEMLMGRLEDHPHPTGRRFPHLSDPLFLTDLYSRAKRLVLSDEALEFALAYSLATTHKKPLHHILADKSVPLGPDLLSQRQKALEKIVPKDIESVELWDWDWDSQGMLMRVPSRIHLEWVCWGYTPDEFGICQCASREFGERLSGVL
jgi:hypothetical protein